ncbi:serine--tRNA ligase [Bartonella sp. DGB2]|uniref:serine--tRNA ligase n=1 Tax=Bartonella sp. DGB2 TaxID=3388426 RepID=UPI00398FE27B
MLDIKWIRDHPEQFDAAMAKRGVEAKAQEVLMLDLARRQQVAKMQELQEHRNLISKEIGKAMAAGNMANIESLKAKMVVIKTRLTQSEAEEKALGQQLYTLLLSLPNIVRDDVPLGKDEDDNLLVRTYGTLPDFDFSPKEHFSIGEAWDVGHLRQMDFDHASRLSGARFVVLSGALARLERALGQFMLNLHGEEHGYQEISGPILVRDSAMYGTGQLPKFAEDSFKTIDGLWLIPTAEVSLTNLVAGEVLDGRALPLRFMSLSPCFRSEAGSAGRDTRGMLRQHQFWKVELVSITDEENSDGELERLTRCAETVLQRLELPYRVMALCTGDITFGSRKTYDLEVWLPGQGRYREVSSCSTCGDFQARRMNARYRRPNDKNLRFVHTLNGSGTALGRCLIAVLENYQQADGSVIIPSALRSYMGGKTCITSAGELV